MRKEKTIKIKDREKDLTFALREMGALKTEKWKFKAIMLLIKGGVHMPDGASLEDGLASLTKGGTEGIIKTLSSIDEERAMALFDEMLFSCVELDVEGVRELLTPSMVDANISDSATLTKLRWELLRLHFDFFGSGEGLNTPAEQPIKVEATPMGR